MTFEKCFEKVGESCYNISACQNLVMMSWISAILFKKFREKLKNQVKMNKTDKIWYLLLDNSWALGNQKLNV